LILTDEPLLAEGDSTLIVSVSGDQPDYKGTVIFKYRIPVINGTRTANYTSYNLIWPHYTEDKPVNINTDIAFYNHDALTYVPVTLHALFGGNFTLDFTSSATVGVATLNRIVISNLVNVQSLDNLNPANVVAYVTITMNPKFLDSIGKEQTMVVTGD
jgi:hypothetical protein